MITVDPRFGAFLRCALYRCTACLASSVVISRYARTTYVTSVCGSRILARGASFSMLGLLLLLSCASAYAFPVAEEHGHDFPQPVLGRPGAQGAECDGFHAVDSDRVEAGRA